MAGFTSPVYISYLEGKEKVRKAQYRCDSLRETCRESYAELDFSKGKTGADCGAVIACVCAKREVGI
jgi:hypothetical protein